LTELIPPPGSPLSSPRSRERLARCRSDDRSREETLTLSDDLSLDILDELGFLSDEGLRASLFSILVDSLSVSLVCEDDPRESRDDSLEDCARGEGEVLYQLRLHVHVLCAGEGR
jgi:hypothetical protein